jgi:hypothetical protein
VLRMVLNKNYDYFKTTAKFPKKWQGSLYLLFILSNSKSITLFLPYKHETERLVYGWSFSSDWAFRSLLCTLKMVELHVPGYVILFGRVHPVVFIIQWVNIHCRTQLITYISLKVQLTTCFGFYRSIIRPILFT